MSEFTNNAEQRAEELANYMQELLQGENGLQLIEKHALKTSKFIPHDIVGAFDILMDKQISIEDLKFVSNKLFNILYQIISYLECIIQLKNLSSCMRSSQKWPYKRKYWNNYCQNQ